MKVREATKADLAIAAGWVDSRYACERWAGPAVSYPPDMRFLPEQITMSDALNLALKDEGGLVGFGQAVRRGPGRAHLARIIVRPDARGRGVGRVLCEVLLDRAAAAGLAEATLYVYRDNPAAAHLYRSLGFRPAPRPPGELRTPEVVFMRLHLGTRAAPGSQ